MNSTKENWLEELVPKKKYRIHIYAKPNAKTEKIEIEPNYLVVSIHSPPEKGKANKEIIEIISNALELSSSACLLVSGHKSRDKVIEIVCSDKKAIDPAEIKRKIVSK